jgi:hypothetical protein
VEARAHTHVRPCRISGGQNGSGTRFPHSSSVFPVNIIPPWLCILWWMNRGS